MPIPFFEFWQPKFCTSILNFYGPVPAKGTKFIYPYNNVIQHSRQYTLVC